MADLTFDNVSVSSLVAAVPKNIQSVETGLSDGPESYHKSFIRQIGISQRHISLTGQTCTDLGYVAAKKALEIADISSASLDAVIFMSQTPDFNPGTSNSFILHNRLNMRKQAFAFDIPLACSSFLYGISVCASFLQQQSINKVLMLCGDTVWSLYENESVLKTEFPFLGGEATVALVLEKKNVEDKINLSLYSDGTGYKYLIRPNEGSKNKWGQFKFQIGSGDHNIEINYPYMDGLEITSFATSTVSDSIKDFLKKQDKTPDDYDALILHQANKQIVKTIGRRVGFSNDKVPMSLDKYANTDGASIPITIADAFYKSDRTKLTLLCSGFGTGLSWAVGELSINPKIIGPIIEVEDDRFTDDFIHLRTQ